MLASVGRSHGDRDAAQALTSHFCAWLPKFAMPYPPLLTALPVAEVVSKRLGLLQRSSASSRSGIPPRHLCNWWVKAPEP